MWHLDLTWQHCLTGPLGCSAGGRIAVRCVSLVAARLISGALGGDKPSRDGDLLPDPWQLARRSSWIPLVERLVERGHRVLAPDLLFDDPNATYQLARGRPVCQSRSCLVLRGRDIVNQEELIAGLRGRASLRGDLLVVWVLDDLRRDQR